MSKLVPGTRLTEQERKRRIEKYDQMMDGLVEQYRRRRQDWNTERAHADAEDFRKFMERSEAFMEKEGIPHTKHSHRFAPDNLWPDYKSSAGTDSDAPASGQQEGERHLNA